MKDDISLAIIMAIVIGGIISVSVIGAYESGVKKGMLKMQGIIVEKGYAEINTSVTGEEVIIWKEIK